LSALLGIYTGGFIIAWTFGRSTKRWVCGRDALAIVLNFSPFVV
jgi:hypothetical protein